MTYRCKVSLPAASPRRLYQQAGREETMRSDQPDDFFPRLRPLEPPPTDTCNVSYMLHVDHAIQQFPKWLASIFVVQSGYAEHRGNQVFSVASLTTWNSLPKHMPVHAFNVFGWYTENIYPFRVPMYAAHFMVVMHYKNSHFTYLEINGIKRYSL